MSTGQKIRFWVCVILAAILFCGGISFFQTKLQAEAEKAYPIGSIIDLESMTEHPLKFRVESVYAEWLFWVVNDVRLSGTLVVYPPEGMKGGAN